MDSFIKATVYSSALLVQVLSIMEGESILLPEAQITLCTEAQALCLPLLQ